MAYFFWVVDENDVRFGTLGNNDRYLYEVPLGERVHPPDEARRKDEEYCRKYEGLLEDKNYKEEEAARIRAMLSHVRRNKAAFSLERGDFRSYMRDICLCFSNMDCEYSPIYRVAFRNALDFYDRYYGDSPW